jgi:hypothetical protein
VVHQVVGREVRDHVRPRVEQRPDEPRGARQDLVGRLVGKPVHQLGVSRTAGCDAARCGQVLDEHTFDGRHAPFGPGDLKHGHERQQRDRVGGEAERLEFVEHLGIGHAGRRPQRTLFGIRRRLRAKPGNQFLILPAEVFLFEGATPFVQTVVCAHGPHRTPRSEALLTCSSDLQPAHPMPRGYAQC